MPEKVVDISPETLHEAAAAFMKARKENEKQMKELDASIKAVQGAWPNAANQTFFQNYKSWEEHMQGFLILLDQIAKDLQAIGNRFESVDD